jgi:hypothetical protein
MNENNTTTLTETEATEYRLTPFETFTKFLVMFFIWLGILFVPSFIIAALEIQLGMIPYILIFAPTFWLCKKASEKWSKYYKARRIKKHLSKASNKELRLPDGCHSIDKNNIDECSEEEEKDSPKPNESSVNSNYKEARKTAKKEYKQKKKELKNSYPKRNINKYKIATIVLSILLLGATIVNIAQFIYIEEEIANLRYENLGLSIEIGDLEIIIESLEDEIERLENGKNWSVDDVDLSKYEIIW